MVNRCGRERPVDPASKQPGHRQLSQTRALAPIHVGHRQRQRCGLQTGDGYRHQWPEKHRAAILRGLPILSENSCFTTLEKGDVCLMSYTKYCMICGDDKHKYFQ